MKHVTWVIAFILLLGCETTSELGSDFIDNPTEIYFTDTITVSMATVLLDSLPTNGLGLQLVGTYLDNSLGQTVAQSYFQLGLNGVFGVDDRSVYDSIALVLHYHGYSYGDTNQAQTLKVLRVTESYEPDEGSLYYNTTILATSTEPLATFEYQSRPQQQDSIVIPINDALGEELWALAQNNDSKVFDGAEFADYFRGISIQAVTGSAVVGFQATPSTCYMEIYYHQEEEVIEARSYKFPLLTETSQFNSIQSNRENTLLQPLSIQREALMTESTEQETYVQAGVGVMTRIQFPHLTNLIKSGNFFLVSAELEIRPVVNSITPFTPLPETLILSLTDAFNALGPTLNEDFTEQPQVAVLQIDEEFGRDTYYRFSLTEYLENELFIEGLGDGLLLTLPQEDFLNAVDRLYVGSNQNSSYTTKLLINYLITS